jgi:hypothetical protein
MQQIHIDPAVQMPRPPAEVDPYWRTVSSRGSAHLPHATAVNPRESKLNLKLPQSTPDAGRNDFLKGTFHRNDYW